ncbi:MAG: fumarylacetoacetate hydrolase family protein [Candidatus Bathyarchaeia archaeon]
MPLDEKTIDALVEEILKAEAARRPAPSIAYRYPDFTVDDAYRVQMRLMERKIEAGERVIGKKAGLTSRVMQTRFGVNEPDFGFITDKMIVPEGETVDLSQLIHPGFDGAEIAFLMKDDVQGPGVNVATALKATAGVLPAIEITSFRVEHTRGFNLRDSIADNGSAGLFVLGGRLTPVEDIDLRLVGMTLEVNGNLAGTAAGAAALGNPAQVVAWLANKLAALGSKLHAGEIVVTGTLIGGLEPHPGDVFKVTFDRLGSVTAVMAK